MSKYREGSAGAAEEKEVKVWGLTYAVCFMVIGIVAAYCMQHGAFRSIAGVALMTFAPVWWVVGNNKGWSYNAEKVATFAQLLAGVLIIWL